MNEKLWDDEHSLYLDFDLAAGQSIYAYVAPNFAGPPSRAYRTKGGRGVW